MSSPETTNIHFPCFFFFLEQHFSILPPSWVLQNENRHKGTALTLHKWPS